MSACDEKSHSSDDTLRDPLHAATSATAASVRARSRPTSTTRAPHRANAMEACSPMPLVAPVTRIVLSRKSTSLRLVRTYNADS